MYKVLIADDEPLIIAGIQSVLDRSDLEIEICGTAANGQVALQIAKEQCPDIIITDIHMPVMNGMELIRLCREHFKNSTTPYFILMADQKDFSIAKKALTYCVSDYLLKPELTSNILEESLQRILNRIHVAESISKAKDNDLHSYYEKFFLRLLFDPFETEEEFLLLSRDLNLDFHYAGYLCCSGKFTDNQRTSFPLSAERRIALLTSLPQLAKRLIPPSFPCYCLTLDTRHFAIIFCYEKLSAGDNPYDKAKALLNNINETLQNRYDISFSFGIGNLVESLQEIGSSYQLSRQAFLSAKKTKAKPLKNAHRNYIVSNVKKYVTTHIREKLSLNEVAAIFGINPSYLSQLFGKYSETGFNEFVNICKINESKKLLKEGNLKIYEISELMGFESAFYFSRVFKKIEGLTPTDYLNTDPPN